MSAVVVAAGTTGGPPPGFNVCLPPVPATGDGVTDDTAAIQATIDAAPEGAVVWFPPGRYRFTRLTLTKTIMLAGGGGYTHLMGRFGAPGFGDGTATAGTVLACTATDGVALDVTGADARQAVVTLRDLALIGVGDATRTTVGIATGTPEAGTHFHRFDNLHIANFKVGLQIQFGFFVTATALNLVGCSTALNLANSANANQFFGVTAELCGEPGAAVLDLSNADANVFHGVCIEGCAGTIIHLRNASATNHFAGLYLENYGTQGAERALHIEPASDENVIDCGHYGGDAIGAAILIEGGRNVLRATKYAVGPITFAGPLNVWDEPILPAGGITTAFPSMLRLARIPRVLTAADSPYTPALEDESLWCNTADGSITIHLPAAGSQIGRRLNMHKIVAANTMTIAAAAIDNTTAHTHTAEGEGRTVECNGSSWRTIARTH